VDEEGAAEVVVAVAEDLYERVTALALSFFVKYLLLASVKTGVWDSPICHQICHFEETRWIQSPQSLWQRSRGPCMEPTYKATRCFSFVTIANQPMHYSAFFKFASIRSHNRLSVLLLSSTFCSSISKRAASFGAKSLRFASAFLGRS
jgi:hypothetical protein